jgi:hypothetical protein
MFDKTPSDIDEGSFTSSNKSVDLVAGEAPDNKTSPGPKKTSAPFKDGRIKRPTKRSGGPKTQEGKLALPIFKRSVERSGMSPESFVQALTKNPLSSLVTWSQVDLETLLLAAERHGLDPLGKDMYLLREGDSYDEPAIVVLGVDGWSRILNKHKIPLTRCEATQHRQ